MIPFHSSSFLFHSYFLIKFLSIQFANLMWFKRAHMSSKGSPGTLRLKRAYSGLLKIVGLNEAHGGQGCKILRIF